MLSDPAEMAHFLVSLGYDRERIERTLRNEFPDVDVAALVDAAEAGKTEADERVERASADEAARARAAEMDLGESMH